MAKKKNAVERDEKKGAGTIVSVIVVLLIIILWLAILAIIIKLDMGGLGTTLRPTLKNIPVVNSILPDIPEELEAIENDYPFTNLRESLDYIKQLEEQIAVLSEENLSYEERIAALEAENTKLRIFEDNVLEFEERVKRFDYQVVFNSKAPSIEEYEKFYHEINQATAEELHDIIARMLIYDEGIQQQANVFKRMKPASAAAIMEESTDDIGRLVKILKSMKDEEASAIIDKMTTLFAAKIFKKMDDMAKEDMENILNELSDYISIGQE